MVITLNENLESLLEKIGPYEESNSFDFWWVGKDSEVPIGLLKEYLEIDFYSYYRSELDRSRFSMWRGSTEYISNPSKDPVSRWDLAIGKYVEEALINAGRRIGVRAFYGQRGVVYSIKDPGDGFQVDKVLKEARATDYYLPRGGEFVGQGFDFFDSEEVTGVKTNITVSWNYKGHKHPIGKQRKGNESYGNEVLICYLFHPEFFKCLKF